MGIKILFSPSESKLAGGDSAGITADSFLFSNLYNKRKEIIDMYNDYISSAPDYELAKLFGIKDSEKFTHYKTDIYQRLTSKAILRYDGVAFDYLNYRSLGSDEMRYIDTNTIIFSNLFGPILAKDLLPDYKLKQGEKIKNFAAEEFYKKEFTSALDEFLQDDFCIDLRAEFYNKFYKPKNKYVTLKFLKNSKVVSHFAKAYRGIVLRHLAINQVCSFDAFMRMQINGLSIKEILQKQNHTEIVFDIAN